MAHNIAQIDGMDAIAYQGETPWHKLGTRLASMTSPDMAMQAAKLDWTVSLADMYYGADRVKSKMRRAVIRDLDGAELGTVGMEYKPIQNVEAFSILNDVCRDFGVTIEVAGALGNGARVWMLAKLADGIQPIPGDNINGYFLISKAHDGTSSLIGRPTPVRVVCANTLGAAMQSGVDIIRIQHSKSAPQRIDAAARMVTAMVGAMKQTEKTFAEMARTYMTAQDVINYIETVFPNPKPDQELSKTLDARRSTVAHLVFNGKGADLAMSLTDGKPNAYAVYQAVTEYFDHVRPAEAKASSAKLSANESAVFGANAIVKAKALTLARQLVAV